MALAVTHVILTIVILDLLRHYVFNKKKFPRYFLIIGGVAGLIPDIDMPLSWLYNFIFSSTLDYHGIYTHSIIFPIICLIIAGILYFKKNPKWATIFGIISFSWFFHLSLDCLYGGYKNLLWPLIFPTNFCPQWGISKYASGIDAIILLVWIVHEEVHKKIKDYI